MPEPIIVIHGVGNRSQADFKAAVDALQLKLDKNQDRWVLLPVFWGDLGAKSEDIADCLPVYIDGRWSVRSEEQLLAASLISRTPGANELSNELRAQRIATAVAGGDPNLVRATVIEPHIAAIAREELPKTHVLKYINDEQVLADLGKTIQAALLEPIVDTDVSTPENPEYSTRVEVTTPEQVRSWLTPMSDRIGQIIHSVDDMLGHVMGTHLGQVNQNLRASIAPAFALFFGDVLVYQRNAAEIQKRIWSALSKIPPSDGAVYGTQSNPVHAIAHSLGGVVTFDAAMQPATSQALWLKSFTTFGSQAAFFHILDPRTNLKPYSHGNPVKLESQIGKWTNLWDTLDILAFTAGTVFQLADGKSPVDIPVQDPLSLIIRDKGITHSVYWDSEELIDALLRYSLNDSQ